MNVLMIHGIGQEDASKQELIEKWTDALHSVHPSLLDAHTVEMAYYGTTLANWTNGESEIAVGMGAEKIKSQAMDVEELRFMNSAIEELVALKGVSQAELNAAAAEMDLGAVPMNSFLARQLMVLMRVVEKISPAKGSILLQVVKQGYTYLSSPGAAKAVDDIVRPLLMRSPQVIITHSLGTVIAFKLLRELATQDIRLDIPLFVTMGSPLALDAFKMKLGLPRRKEDFVKRWENFYDPSDFVTLGKPLTVKNFAKGINNDGQVDNFTANCHGVIGYLPHPGVITALEKVLLD